MKNSKPEKKKKGMHEGHRQRLKAKYLNYGHEGLEDHEILELLLFYAIPFKDTNETAHKLMEKYDYNLARIFEADIADLRTVKGIETHAAILLNLLSKIASRYESSKRQKGQILGTTEEIGKYAIDAYIGKTDEEFAIISLDSNRRVINYEILSKGTANQAVVFPRKVIQYLGRGTAVNIVLIHNHPNGSVLPSEQDKRTTQIIDTLVSALGVNLIDHIIVSGESFYSMKEMGNF